MYDRITSAPMMYFNADRRLAICRAPGQLDIALAARLLDFALAMEAADPKPFDRLLDFTEVAEVRLSGPELYRLAQVRREACAGRAPFRTAMLAPAPLAFATAKLYESLTEGCGVNVGVFREAEPAAEWLGVPRPVVER